MKRSVGSYLVLASVMMLAVSPLEAVQERFTSPDRSVSVIAPSSWAPLDLNDEAIIEIGNAVEESYLVVLTDRTDDLFGWNLTRHSHITLGQLLTGIDFPEVSGPQRASVGGCPAVQYEIRGISSGSRIAYLHTTIESENLFAQVIVWTLQSRWRSSQALLRAVVESIDIANKGTC